MNKLVIVGNGFDLAHNLPTSYKDFIDDFWKNIKTTYKKDEIKLIVDINQNYYGFLDYNPINNFEDLISNLEEYCKKYGYKFNSDKNQYYTDSSQSTHILKFENSFFEEINKRNVIDNWVDIENLYYSELKKVVKAKKMQIDKTDEDWMREKKLKTKRLNIEFEQIKKLLEDYLDINVNQKFSLKGRIQGFDKVLQFFEVKPRYIEATKDNENYLMQFSKSDHKEIIEFDDKLILADENYKIRELIREVNSEILFLNFNYTNSLIGYIELMNSGKYGNYFKAKEIPIHGKLNDMNFGFGDEMDEDYKLIENINDNEYLKNFKSFQYLKNSNYKKLLDFIDGQKFQVYIMGHSCGLSDRTLLNTIFEHLNCRSIKIFYHEKEESDNFTDIIYNISRHFNKKSLMREKIVNKTLCKPLYQDARFTENSS